MGDWVYTGDARWTELRIHGVSGTPPESTLRLFLSRLGKRAVIRLADCGEGMEDGILADAFRRYARPEEPEDPRRGAGFSLNPELDDYLAPRKKPYHTIIPGFLTHEGEAVGPFGVMGAYMQPQGHVQVIMNTVDWLLNPQSALDAPRWQWIAGKEIWLESSVAPEIVEDLRRRGHEVRVLEDDTTFGRGEIIWRDSNGVLAGATEPRADGVVAAW